MRKESSKDLPWFEPAEGAEIAIKALQGGDVNQIAAEHGTSPASVLRLRAILEENAIDLFLPDIEGKSICKSLGEIRCQILIMEGVINEVAEVIGIRNGNYFSD